MNLRGLPRRATRTASSATTWVYEYNGRRYSTRVAQDPGDRIALDVTTTPVGTTVATATTVEVVPSPVYAPAPVYGYYGYYGYNGPSPWCRGS